MKLFLKATKLESWEEINTYVTLLVAHKPKLYILFQHLERDD